MAKKPTRPRKFRQARKDALAEAKKSFSGKKQAGLKDRTLKISADDKEVLSEMRKEAKGGYITDDRGNKIQVKPTETAQERIARDRREAKAQLQQKWDQEDGKARAPKETPATKKSSVKKPSVGGTAGTTAKPKAGLMNQIKKDVAKVNAKSMTRAEKSAANKAAWAKMTPAERKNWSASKPAAAPKTVATTPKVKTGVAAKGELKTAAEVDKYKQAVAQGKSKGEAVRIAKGGSANLPAVLPKKGAGTVATTGAKSAAAKKLTAAGVLKAVGKGAWKATGGKVGMGLTAAALLAEPIQKALSKDTKGRTTWDLLNEGKLRPAPKTTADYGRAVPGGLKGKGKAAAAAAGVTAGAAAMKQRSNQPRITGQGKYKGKAATFGAGGTTSVYKVETGDTLSGIAKKAGVTLAELMEANKKIKDPRKIYRNTTVKIPAKGKMPTPMYTGPVPYVPGSKAAKAYEASRKK